MEKLELIHSWWDYKKLRSLWKTVWQVKRLNGELAYDPAITFIGLHPREFKVHVSINICTSMFIGELCTTAKS